MFNRSNTVCDCTCVCVCVCHVSCSNAMIEPAGVGHKPNLCRFMKPPAWGIEYVRGRERKGEREREGESDRGREVTL